MSKSRLSKGVSLSLRYIDRAGGRQAIYLETYIHGKRKFEPLKLTLVPEVGKEEIRANKQTLKKANAILKERKKAVIADEELNKPKYKESDITLYDSVPLLVWLTRCSELKKQSGQDCRYINRLIQVIESFSPKVCLDEMDRIYCLDFINYLKIKGRTPKGKRYKEKTMFNYQCELVTALNCAVHDGLINMNPFTLLQPHEKFKNRESQRDYLTIDEVKRLIATPCREQIVKQAYLFACSCGLRLGDLLAITWKDISHDGERAILATKVHKTKRPIFLPLGRQALRWMPERKEDGKDDDRIFSDLKENTLSEVLNEWAASAGIDKNVTFHTSRHTFATTMLTLGADLYTVSKLLGHTSVRHTQIYARIVNRKKDIAVSLVDNVFPVSDKGSRQRKKIKTEKGRTER